MSDPYSTPKSNVRTVAETDPGEIRRPISIYIIGYLFIGLAILDLVLTIKNGIVTRTFGFGSTDGSMSSGFSVQLLWLALYGAGAGVLRRGKFARFMACFFGIFMAIIPGAIFIYLLYFSESKFYFNDKACPICKNQRWLNIDFPYKKLQCKSCGHKLTVQRT